MRDGWGEGEEPDGRGDAMVVDYEIVAHDIVKYSKRGATAHILLNRPAEINAFNVQMRDDLYRVLEAVRDDPDVRVAVLGGTGERGFCAGADLTEFGTAPSQVIARSVRWERDLWGLFMGVGKPLIAALHGHVIGSGVEIACLCDLRVASEDAVFKMPETALAMAPAAGGTQTLPRAVGVGRAMDLLLTGRRVTAPEARRLGLVHRVVSRDRLAPETERLAGAIASLDPEAVSAVRAAIGEGMDLPLAQGLALERRLAARLIGGSGPTPTSGL